MYVQKTVCLVCHAVLSLNLYLTGVMTKYPLKGGVQLWAVPISTRFDCVRQNKVTLNLPLKNPITPSWRNISFNPDISPKERNSRYTVLKKS